MIRTRTALTLLAATLVASTAQAQTSPTPTPSASPAVVPPPPPVELPEALRAQPGGITAEQAARRAVATSLSVRAARANVDAAGAARSEAALSMIPQINLSARYTRLSEIEQPRLSFGPSTCIGQGGALFSQLPTAANGAMQCPTGTMLPPGSGGFSFPVILDNIAIRGTVTIPITDIPLRLARVYEAAGLNEQARRLDEEAARNTAGSEARVAFYELLRARGQHAVAQQGAETASRHREDLVRFVEAGTVARVELLRVEAQLAEAERLVIAAREGVTMAEAQLRQRLHIPGEGPLTLGESLDESPALPRTSRGSSTARGATDPRSRASSDRAAPSTRTFGRRGRASGRASRASSTSTSRTPTSASSPTPPTSTPRGTRRCSSPGRPPARSSRGSRRPAWSTSRRRCARACSRCARASRWRCARRTSARRPPRPRWRRPRRPPPAT